MTVLLVILDATIVNIALPAVSADLGIDAATQQWIVTAYTLTFGGLLLLGGRIADFWGRKRTYLVGAAGFAVASALGGLAQNEAMLFGARALQGAFGALLAPASLALLTVLFTDTKERAKAFAVYGAIAGGGSAVGLLLGGVLTEYADWRWCFWVNLPVAIVAIALAIPIVPESKAPGDTSYDVPGAVLDHPRSRLGRLRLHAGGPERAGERRRPGARRQRLDRAAGRCSSSAPAPCWSPRSSSSSCGPAIRCCRCASCSTATAAGRT